MGFAQIISQEKVIKLLRGTLRTKKIPSAFLFIGDSYIGKTRTAIAYAKALNCLNYERNLDFCDECISCKKINSGLHPDIKVIAPEKDSITVSNIREVEEFVSFHPLEARHKVVIIKKAHQMNQSAANAFLKTLEEPPLNTTIILICENIYALPDPLISRCFKIYFTPLSVNSMKEIIPDSPEKEILIKLTMGRPGLFISRDILKDVQQFAETLKDKERKSIWKDNEEIKWWIDFLCIFIRDALNNKFLSNCCQILPLNFKLKKDITVEEILNLYEELQQVRRNIDLNLNKSIVWNYIERLLRRVIDV